MFWLVLQNTAILLTTNYHNSFVTIILVYNMETFLDNQLVTFQGTHVISGALMHAMIGEAIATSCEEINQEPEGKTGHHLTVAISSREYSTGLSQHKDCNATAKSNIKPRHCKLTCKSLNSGAQVNNVFVAL